VSLQDRLLHIQGQARLPSVVAGVATGGAVAWTGGAGDVPDEPALT
jgi:hypothetical protein